MENSKIRVAIINDTRPTNHYGCMLVMQNLLNLLSDNGIEVIWSWPVGIDWRKHKRKLKAKPKVDAFIVNGEGTIHHSAVRKHARALSEFANFAQNELATPSYLINATLFENEKSLYQNLNAYKLIYVRDAGSLAELTNFGLVGSYVPDLTFAKASSHSYAPRKKGCVVDTALKSDIPQLKRYCEKNQFDFRTMVVARPSNANFFKSPRPYVKNIYKWLTGDWKVSTDPATYIDYLCQYELVVTGRYHTVTMCLKNKIPFVAFESNTPKISFVLNDVLGSDNRVVPFSELDNIDLTKYRNYSAEELSCLDSFIDEAENKISTMITTISTHIQKTHKLD